MIRFVPGHLKTKNMCKHAVTKLPFITGHVPDRYQTQQMCDKAVVENGGTWKFIPLTATKIKKNV